jgi:iron complex outermembrane receptor protein
VQLGKVVVTGQRSTVGAGQVSTQSQLGVLGDRNVFDTPFSTSAYTDELIRDQQARSIADVTDNDAAVRSASSRYSESIGYAIRGFPVYGGDVLFDGLYGLVDYRDPALEGIERIDVFKGPSALVNNGASDTAVGGTINLVPKRATAEPIDRLTLGYDSNADSEAHLDIGRRFGADNAFGARINIGGRVGDTPIDNQFEQAGNGTLGLDYNGQRLRASFDFSSASRKLLANLSVFLVDPGFAIPKAPEASSNVVDHSSYFHDHNTFGAGQIEYDLLDHLTVFAAYGHRRLAERYKGPYAPEITDAGGDVNIAVEPYAGGDDTDVARFGLRGSFDTGPVAHQLTLSADGYWDREEGGYATDDTLTTNIYHPRPLAPDVPNYPDAPNNYLDSTRRGSLALADVATAFDGRLSVIAGVREQSIASRSADPSSGEEQSTYNKSKLTPAAAVLYKLLPHLSIYGNYIQALQSGPTAPTGTANANQIFPPLVASQIEAGAKVDFGIGGMTLAAYQIEQPSGITDPSTNVFSGDGEQRNRGLELNVFGTVLPGLRLLGGYSLIDAVQAKTDDANQGKKAVGTPRNNLNLGTEWDVPYLAGLTATARAIYTSRQFYDPDDSRSIPSWTRFDAGARYAFVVNQYRLTARAEVENLANKNYWSSAQQGYLAIGAPRTFLMSLSSEF